MENNSIIVHCGLSIESKCDKQLHPLSEVNKAKEIIDNKQYGEYYSNSPDFVSTIKYYGESNGINCIFTLNNEYQGSNIKDIFNDFNKSFTLLDKLCPEL